jgi:hypothetical protein
MCLLTSAQSGNAVDFVASGVVEVQSFDDGRVEFDYSNTFSVTFTDCKYFIQVLGSQPFSKRQVAAERLFDGTNTCLFYRYDTNVLATNVAVNAHGLLEENPLLKPIPIKNSGNMEIVRGHFTTLPDSQVNLLWLAFAAQCYYSTEQQGAQRPLNHLGLAYYRNDIVLKTHWALAETPIHFLKHRVDYDSGTRYYMQNGVLASAKRPGGLSQGYTNSEYVTLVWTNIAQMTFPKQFSFKIWGPKDDLDQEVHLLGLAQGWVTNIALAKTETPITLHTQENVIIHDARPEVTGNSQQSFRYFSPSGIPDNLDQMRRTAEYGRYRKTEAAKQGNTQTPP